MTIQLNCPYCSVLVEVDPLEEGGPMAGENLICAACNNVFTLNQRMPVEEPPLVVDPSGEAVMYRPGTRRIGILETLGAILRGMVVGLALVTLMVMMFIFGWAYGDGMFSLFSAMFG
ncbi:MAG: hypothetical protein OXD31_00620 [Chloroflexi bacterium]|nr:hypothetical protein [Chloroflexota bacterium]